MTSKTKSLTKLMLAVIVIAFLAYVAFFGVQVGGNFIGGALNMEKSGIKLGFDLSGGSIITYESNNDVLMDLEAGRIDAAVADEVIVKYYVKKKGAEKFKILDEDFGDEEYGVGIRKGDKAMVEAFNKAYEELKEEGTLANISIKWFGEDITC